MLSDGRNNGKNSCNEKHLYVYLGLLNVRIICKSRSFMDCVNDFFMNISKLEKEGKKTKWTVQPDIIWSKWNMNEKLCQVLHIGF